MLYQGSHRYGNIFFQDISRTNSPFSRTKYISFPRQNICLTPIIRNKCKTQDIVRLNMTFYCHILVNMYNCTFFWSASSIPLIAVRSTHSKHVNWNTYAIKLILNVKLWVFRLSVLMYKKIIQPKYFPGHFQFFSEIPGH